MLKIIAHVKQGKPIDWPQDGKPRPREIKFSVGFANPPAPEPKILKRWASGSVKETMLDGIVTKHDDKAGK